jgi:hypothetical protein
LLATSKYLIVKENVPCERSPRGTSPPERSQAVRQRGADGSGPSDCPAGSCRLRIIPPREHPHPRRRPRRRERG